MQEKLFFLTSYFSSENWNCNLKVSWDLLNPLYFFTREEKKIICIAYSWISEFHSRQNDTWVPRSSQRFLYIGADVSFSHLHQGHSKLSEITNLCIIPDFDVLHRFRKQASSLNAFIWLNMTLQILSTIKDSIRQDYWGTNM